MTWMDKGRRRLHMPSHPRATPQGMINEHVVIVEKVLGYTLDPKNHIHHHNEIPSDNRNENLVVCENNAYHRLLHARMRIQQVGGDPDTQKFCCQCKQLLLRTQFYRSGRSGDGFAKMCKSCCLTKQRIWQGKNRDKISTYNRKYRPRTNAWKRQRRKAGLAISG